MGSTISILLCGRVYGPSKFNNLDLVIKVVISKNIKLTSEACNLEHGYQVTVVHRPCYDSVHPDTVFCLLILSNIAWGFVRKPPIKKILCHMMVPMLQSQLKWVVLSG